MNLGNVASVMQMAYQKANQTQRNSVTGNSFTDSLQEAKGANMSTEDVYTEHLRSKYGNVMIMAVGKDQNSMDNLGMGTAGYGNVVIAPNILEQMANDPEKAAYYEKKIQDYFKTIPETEAFMRANGFVTTSDGIVIHEDGTVTHYLSGEESPEKKAKFEAAQKEKREKKAAERRESLERSQEVAEESRRMLEEQYRAQMMSQMRQTQFDNPINFYFMGEVQKDVPAVSSFERAISTIGSSVMQNL